MGKGKGEKGREKKEVERSGGRKWENKERMRKGGKFFAVLTDASVISLSHHSPKLRIFTGCVQLTDSSIIPLTQHCPNLQEIIFPAARELTDASILSISLTNFSQTRGRWNR